MYAYCAGNPINYVDSSGYSWAAVGKAVVKGGKFVAKKVAPVVKKAGKVIIKKGKSLGKKAIKKGKSLAKAAGNAIKKGAKKAGSSIKNGFKKVKNKVTGKLKKKNKGVGNSVKSKGKGSTGRTSPKTLNEQMAMHQVKSNPLKGASKLPIQMTDSRWPQSNGWVKMQSIVKNSDGSKTTIHFVYNTITGAFDDFKFK